MSAYPTFSGSDSQHVSLRSPSSHLESLGKTASSSEYPKIQSAVVESLPNTQADQSSPRFAGLPYPLRNGDGERSALMADPERFLYSRPNLYSQTQQRVTMEDSPMGKKLTRSTDASPGPQSTSSGAPAEAEIQSEEEEEFALTASEVEENATDVGVPRVGAERLTERRKLKRFRLVS